MPSEVHFEAHQYVKSNINWLSTTLESRDFFVATTPLSHGIRRGDLLSLILFSRVISDAADVTEELGLA